MDKNKEIIKELNDFLRGLNMGHNTFEKYLEKAEDKNLKNEFTKILSIFSSQKEIIISYIEGLNGDPKDSLGLGGEIASMYEKLKDVFINSDKELLENAIKAVDMGIPQSKKVITDLERITADKSMIEALNNMIAEYEMSSKSLHKIYQGVEK